MGILGDVYRFLATAEETGGRYALIEALILPGNGPPPHLHRREEEGFFILEGEMTIQIGQQRHVFGPGAFANMPIGVPHSFRNESDRPARMLITLAPAGLEKMFFEVGDPLQPGATEAPPVTQETIDKLTAAAPRFGIEFQLPQE